MRSNLALALLLCLSTVAQAHGRHHGHGYSDGRPSAWCGWQMRQWKGGGPELNLARNWARVGIPTTPQIGAVVVWPHHVGILTGKAPNGMWIVRSGNDGHQVRERERSVAGAIAFRLVGHA